jgi:lactoylglutathione lyase
MDLKLSLHHVGVYTKDVEASRRFYETMFGFSTSWAGEVPLEAGLYKAAMIERGTCVIELVQPPDPGKVPAAHGPIQHIALRTQDLKRAIRRLQELGAIFESAEATAMPEFTACGVWHAFITGPSGERIELVEDMPSSQS